MKSDTLVIDLAQNPADNWHLGRISPGGVILGCDFSGIVTELGSSVASFKKGDKVAGTVHGGTFKDKGAYAEYLKADADMIWKVPEGMDMGAAATWGVAATTAAMVCVI